MKWSKVRLQDRYREVVLAPYEVEGDVYTRLAEVRVVSERAGGRVLGVVVPSEVPADQYEQVYRSVRRDLAARLRRVRAEMRVLTRQQILGLLWTR